MIRAFVALPLPPDVQSALRVQQFLLRLPDAAGPPEFHLTLAFLGEQPEPRLEEVHYALLALRTTGFDLALRGLGMFGGAKPRAIWAGVAPSAPLVALQAKVETAIRRQGVDLPARKFVPHVTLATLTQPGPEQVARLSQAVALGDAFSCPPWRVDEMVLYESRLSAKGARYDELARYSIGGG